MHLSKNIYSPGSKVRGELVDQDQHALPMPEESDVECDAVMGVNDANPVANLNSLERGVDGSRAHYQEDTRWCQQTKGSCNLMLGRELY